MGTYGIACHPLTGNQRQMDRPHLARTGKKRTVSHPNVLMSDSFRFTSSTL